MLKHAYVCAQHSSIRARTSQAPHHQHRRSAVRVELHVLQPRLELHHPLERAHPAAVAARLGPADHLPVPRAHEGAQAASECKWE